MSLLSGLNDQQLKAVTSDSPTILNLAGAGSGKTRVLTSRINYLHQEKRVGTSNILAITFTRLAAKEMKERVMHLVGTSEGHKLTIGTFHSFCVRILKEWGHLVSLEKNFTIYTEDDRRAIIQSCINELGYKVKLQDVLDNLYKDLSDWDVSLVRVLEEYEYRLKRNNAADLDGLLVLAKDVLSFPQAQAELQNRYRYVFVDEFFDTNDIQLEIINLLNPDNLFVVGDDFQCWAKDGLVTTLQGDIPIANLQVGDRVLSMVKGKVEFADVTGKSNPIIKEILSIKTKSGKVLRVSPEHKCFTTLPSFDKGRHYLYLMYRKDKGFRIGLLTGGLYGTLFSRTHPERPERLWLLAGFDDKDDAAYSEEYLSLKYNVPTNPFYHNGRNISLGQSSLDKLFAEFGENGQSVLYHFGYEFDYPHYVPQGTVKYNSRIININLLLNLPKNGTMVSYESGGERVRKVFCNSQGYKDARLFAEKLAKEKGANVIVEKYSHDKHKYLSVIPANQLLITMKIPVIEDRTEILDEIIEISRESKQEVYHVEVARTGILIVNNVVSHNSIYQFRGANVQNIIDFPNKYYGCEVVKLERNYRSTKQIVSAANALIKHNVSQTEKVLIADRDGADITYLVMLDEGVEAMNVADMISAEFKLTETWSDIAVLARTNRQLQKIKENLDRRNIPSLIVSSQDDVFKKHDIRMIIAFIEAAINPLDDMNVRKVINFPEARLTDLDIQNLELKALNIGQSLSEVMQIGTVKERLFYQLLESAKESSEERETALEVIEEAIHQLDLRYHYYNEGLNNRAEDLVTMFTEVERWQNVQESLGEPNGIFSFLKWLRMKDIQEKLVQEKVDVVKLMTVHASKGLEFPVVFVIGMNQNVFPSKRTEDMEEERRLFYVAITRAKDRLYLTRPEQRVAYPGGPMVLQAESQFIREINIEQSRGTSQSQGKVVGFEWLE